jgi:hypothetical protein
MAKCKAMNLKKMIMEKSPMDMKRDKKNGGKEMMPESKEYKKKTLPWSSQNKSRKK